MSLLSHSGIALAGFLLVASWLGPNAGMVGAVVAYWAREGAEAQWASGLPKSKTWWYPWAPWVWPRQMILDAALPAVTAVGARLVWGAMT